MQVRREVAPPCAPAREPASRRPGAPSQRAARRRGAIADYVLDFPEGATLEERRLLLMSILFAEQVVYPKRKQGPIQC